MKLFYTICLQDRVNLVKNMNEIVKSLNDESFYWGTWAHVVPDEADESDFQEIAQDEELFDLVCEKFCKIISMQYFFCGGKIK